MHKAKAEWTLLSVCSLNSHISRTTQQILISRFVLMVETKSR